MTVEPISPAQAKERMVKALRIAREAWKEAEMPRIFDEYNDETGKIALAKIAVEVFRAID